MSDEDTSVFRKRLLALREELSSISEISDGLSDVVELDQARVGRLSRMDAMQAQAMAQASDRRRQLVLTRITVALARLDKGEYGFCRSCEEPINPKRLEFDPTADMCVSCAEKDEL